MQGYGNPDQPGYQRPMSLYGSQPSPSYGANTYQQNQATHPPSTSTPVYQQQWEATPPSQTPTAWNRQQQQQQQQQQSQPHQSQSQQYQNSISSGYNPNVYGPITGSQPLANPGPPLPPRASSATQAITTSYYQNLPQQQGVINHDTPPPPPPVPSAYQAQQQTWGQTQNISNHSTQQSQDMNNQLGHQANYLVQAPQTYPVTALGSSQTSQAPGGSYFPSPPCQNTYGMPLSGASTDISSPVSPPETTSAFDPGESHPAYIPPSLSGQGVAAYLPSNTNPLPGVYVPPPPDIPAWTQVQHAPLAGQQKKFKYTRPVIHSVPPSNPYLPMNQNAQVLQQNSAQFQPGISYNQRPSIEQYSQQPNQVTTPNPLHSAPQQPQTPQYHQIPQQYQPPQQHQISHQLQTSQRHQIPQHYQQTQQYLQPQQHQPLQHVPLKQPGGVLSNNHTSAQQWMAQTVNSQSSQPEPYMQQGDPSYRPSHFSPGPKPESSWQNESSPSGVQQHFQNTDDQTSQQTTAPVSGAIQTSNCHQRSSDRTEQSRPESQTSQSFHDTPVSPISRRQTMNFNQNDPQGIASTSANWGGIAQSARLQGSPQVRTSTPLSKKTALDSDNSAEVASASALGFGGPSDWEHFGPINDEEDTAPPSPQYLDSVELPSHPSPKLDQEAIPALNAPDDEWATPPPPKPLNINRPPSGFQQRAPNDHGYAPTPPPPTMEQDTHMARFDIHEAPTYTSPVETKTESEETWHSGVTVENLVHTNETPKEIPEAVNEKQYDVNNFTIDTETNDINHAFVNAQHPLIVKPLETTPPREQIASSVQPAQFHPPQPRDIIPDLDPWYVGSLNRYVAMLRSEALAVTVEEKRKIFTDFVNAESRVRGIDYDAQPSNATSTVERIERHVSPANNQHEKADPILTAARPVSHPVNPDAIDATAVERYSPGGRPIISHLLQCIEHDVQQLDVANHSANEAAIVHSNDNDQPESAKDNQKITHDDNIDYAYRNGADRPVQKAHASNPITPTGETFTGPLYKPYNHSAVSSNSNDPAILTPTSTAEDYCEKSNQQRAQVPERPLYQPYVPGGSGSSSYTPTDRFHSKSYPYSSNTPRHEHGEIFLEQIEVPKPTKSEDVTSPTEGSETRNTPTPPATHRKTSLQELTALLSQIEVNNTSEYEPLKGIQEVSTQFTSDFSYIETLFRDWDRSAGTLRSHLEHERRLRQQKSEEQNDALFNGNEIGYGDIAALEEEFKAAEQKKKAQEGRDEYQTYVEDVFSSIYDRLQTEIRQLMELFVETKGLLRQGVAGKVALDETTAHERPNITRAMEVLLTINAKVEDRHEKVFQTVVERDRRYKRTEVQPLYMAGDIKKMKSVERQFEDAEKMAVVNAAMERDGRAQSLMDIIDESTVRGVGENQEFIDQIMTALRDLHDAHPDEEGKDKEEKLAILTKARNVLEVLAKSSEIMIRNFHTVEAELNGADYEVQVAKARAEGAEQPTFKALAEEKGKEDMKLKAELERRIEVVNQDLREAEQLIERLRLAHGKDSSKNPEEAEKERRMKAALEEAKRRNGEVSARKMSDPCAI
ncbi:hypothetical protein M501DRAFT_985028 [Patellaria atrata CBS 101060]|uniref:Uncharacterized protein n=1 Tax=Patellaria atrata CBS 101060 TaxID=1346257 RepID=A0A9P4SJS3_9PEZI|nr:hypothetical protein M501DRAFT_985028 [Patellaria atrata CBS 101060]